jgi:hypothetical protein
MNKKYVWFSVAFVTFFIGLVFGTWFVVKNFLPSPDVESIIPLESIEKIQENELEDESYAVYSTLLKTERKSDGFSLSVQEADLTVIREETIDCGNDNADMKVNEMREQMENYALKELGVKYELTENFHLRNKYCHRLQEKLVSDKKYVFLSKSDENSIFSGKGIYGWSQFDEKFPRSTGIIGFSNVGFNQDRKQALVYVTRSCGGKCGEGDYVLMEKENNVWKIKNVCNTWVS